MNESSNKTFCRRALANAFVPSCCVFVLRTLHFVISAVMLSSLHRRANDNGVSPALFDK